MTTLGEAMVPIRAMLDKLDGDLAQAKSKINGVLGKGVDVLSAGFSNMQKVGKAALGVVAVGAGVAATALGVIGSNAIGMNAQLETSTLQFETLMGDAGRAEEHVKSLFEFAKKTPFETGPIIEASRLMQTFGGDALNTEANLLLIGDAAAATSAPINELGFWSGRLFSQLQAGKPFGEAAARLQELAVISPQARAEMEELQAAGASADEIWGVFQEDLSRFSGAMEKQAGTWEGLKSTILDAVGIISATALKPLFDLLKSGAGALADLLSSDQVAAGAAIVAAAIQGVGEAVSNFVLNIQSGIPFLTSLDILVGQIALSFGATLPEALALGDAVVGFVEKVQTAVQPIVDWIAQNVELQDVLMGLGVAIATVILPIIGGIVLAIAPVIATFALVTGAIALLRTAWEENWGGIQEKTQAAMDFVSNLITTVMTAVQAFWAANGEAILAKASEIWGAIRDFVNTTIATIQTIITTVASSIQTFWAAHGEFILATAERYWTAIMDYVGGIWETLKALFAAFRSAFEGDWYAFGQNLRVAWDTLWQTVLNFLRGLWSVVQPILSSLLQNMVSSFTSTDWGSVGQGIINGIANAISAGVGAITEAARNVAQAALDAAKGFLGISSPSKVAEHEIGEPFALGIVGGVVKKIPTVIEAGVSLARSMIESVKETIQAEGGSLFDGLIEAASKLEKIGSVIGNVFKAREVDPLQERMDELSVSMKDWRKLIPKLAKDLEKSLGFSVENMSGLDLIGLTWRGKQEGMDPALLADLRNLWAAKAKLNELSHEAIGLSEQLADKEAALAAIEEQRQNIAILQAQQDLLNLVKDNNLGTELLSGFKFGLDANLQDILTATASAMEAIVKQAESSLGIASPSTVAEKLAGFFDKGAAIGFDKAQQAVKAAKSLSGRIVDAAALMAQPGTPMMATEGAAAAGGDIFNFHFPSDMARRDRSDIERMIDAAMAKYGIKADIRLRTK